MELMTDAGLIASVTSTGSGFLLVLALMIPLAGALLAFVCGGRQVEHIALAVMLLGVAVAFAIAFAQAHTGAPLVYLIGGWTPPLGVALRADGLSVVMMMITAVVICGIGVFAHSDFRTPAGSIESRAPFAFWILLLAIWAALNAIFLGGDLFTLYVALELLTFAAVPLVCLDGRVETLRAALRYLLFALLGSALYLAGTTLVYGAYGTLDITLLARRVHGEPVLFVAAALMTTGLLAKTALFPLHLWLPPAHAGAPAAASAVLSALVVKGSFFIAVRLWFDAMPGVPGPAAMQVLGALGVGAIVFGSFEALRQKRLKLLIAYSTLAQIGYLFLMFPLAFPPGSTQLANGGALAGGILQAMSHASAKAAMFMAAGLIYAELGHDRIAGLVGIGRTLPISALAFTLAGLALIGLAPSGAYLSKDLLLGAASETGQWWWAAAIQAGGVLTAGYVLLVVVHALAPASRPAVPRERVSHYQEAAALALALCSLLLGLIPWGNYLPFSPRTSFNPFTLSPVLGSLWAILGGAVLAILLGRWDPRLNRLRCARDIFAMVRPARGAGLILSRITAELDTRLRQWPVAGVYLLVVLIVFGIALEVAR
jgi:formate hydrogenlyase subunit 3/multisubunit Na+/H+ antiporter MnhD subunit